MSTAPHRPYQLRGDVLLAARSHTREATAFAMELYQAAYQMAIESPGDIWSALFAASPTPEGREIFERARAERGAYVLPDDLVFPADVFPFSLQLWSQDRAFAIEVADREELSLVAQALSGEPAEAEAAELADELRTEGLLAPVAPTLRFDRPGIYRGQHACLIFRSEAATVIVDPVTGMDRRPHLAPMLPDMLRDVDAVLISHSHEDHFSLLTLMQFPLDTIMIVPAVSRGSMLSRDMAAELRAAGFRNVIAAAWHTSHRVKDMTIHVYPFFGEQPWLTFASPDPALRNLGNTYLVDACGHKSWVLIDSGVEYLHSMEDTVADVLAAHGHVDLVLSNLRVFPWGPHQIDGSGRYWLCFPAEILDRPSLWPVGQRMTFGIDGMQSFLAKLRPTHFLPYAHWWAIPSETVELDGALEPEHLRRLSEAAPHTQCHHWTVGDHWDITGMQPRVSAG